MIKYCSFLLLAITICKFSFGQISYTHDNGGNNKILPDSIYFSMGSNENPLILINGITVNLDTVRNLDSLQHEIGIILIGVDSEKTALYHERHNGNRTFVERFFGPLKKNGIVFLFTKTTIQYCSPLNINYNILKNESKLLWKINEEPITNNISEIQKIPVNSIKKVLLIKNFPLWNYKTKVADTFKLFIVNTKL